MRIISGKAGRIAIKVPAAVSRPTTDFVRQAIFSMLGEQVIGSRVLDLYAGSGAIGLEALSRGATSCTFIDEHRQACNVIQENLEKTKLSGGRVIKAQVISQLKRDPGSYDLIFADPPYWKHHGDSDHLRELFDSGLLPQQLKPGGWLIAEASSHYDPPQADGLTLTSRREYGSSAILLYAAASAH